MAIDTLHRGFAQHCTFAIIPIIAIFDITHLIWFCLAKLEGPRLVLCVVSLYHSHSRRCVACAWGKLPRRLRRLGKGAPPGACNAGIEVLALGRKRNRPRLWSSCLS